MALWTPANLAVPPVGWWDAQDTSTLTLDAQDTSTLTLDATNHVLEWRSKAGTNPATGDNSAVYQATGWNSTYPAVRVYDSPLYLANINGFSTGTADGAIIAVAQILDTRNYPQVFNYGPTAAYQQRQIFARDRTDHLVASNNSIDGDTGISSAGGAFIVGTYAGGNAVSTYTNGGATPYVVSASFNTGTSGGAIGPGWAGPIGEIIVLGYIPNTADRQLIEGYTAWRWGLQAKLPADHPYKNAAPTAAASASVTPDSASQAQAPSSPNLGAKTSLSPDGASQLQSTTSPTATSRSAAQPVDARQSAMSTSPVLAARSAVAPDSASNLTTATTPTLGVAGQLTPVAASQMQSASSPIVTARTAASPDPAVQSQTATQPALSVAGALVVNSASQPQVTSQPSLTARTSIAPAPASQSMIVTVPALVVRAFLSPSPATQGQAASMPNVSARVALVPISALQAMRFAEPSLYVGHRPVPPANRTVTTVTFARIVRTTRLSRVAA